MVSLCLLLLKSPMAKKRVNLSVKKGEKLPVSKGAGLTAKGRAKYNRETGSNLKPFTFCAKSLGNVVILYYCFLAEKTRSVFYV